MAKDRANYEQRIQTVCLLILTAMGITAGLYFFSSVLIPFVLAIFLTLCLTPVIDLQMKWLRIPRRTAIFTTLVIGCGFLALGTLLVTAAVDQIVQNREDYEDQFQQLLVRGRGLLPPEWYAEPNEPARNTKKPTLNSNKVSDPNGIYDFNEAVKGPTEPLIRVPTNTLRKILTDIASSVMGIVQNGLLVVIFMIFMIAGKG